LLEVAHEIVPGRRWVIAIAPDEAEIERLVREHGVPREVVEHSLDARERARLAQQDGVTFIVLRSPVRGTPGGNLPRTTTPFGLVWTDRDVVTIAAQDNEVIAQVRAATAALDAPHRVTLAHLRATADTFLAHIEELEQAIDVEEERLARSQGNREVLELVRLMKSLVHFTAALRSLEHLVERMQKAGWLEVPEEDLGALDDTLIELRQALETCNLERETLGETMDAFASIISNNLNAVMKLLAALTLVTSPPLILASLWGMNVPVPWAHAPWAFWTLVAISIALCLAIAVAMVRRRWM
jgi:magnesium transporter